jgi:hypothetical protein
MKTKKKKQLRNELIDIELFNKIAWEIFALKIIGMCFVNEENEE